MRRLALMWLLAGTLAAATVVFLVPATDGAPGNSIVFPGTANVV